LFSSCVGPSAIRLGICRWARGLGHAPSHAHPVSDSSKPYQTMPSPSLRTSGECEGRFALKSNGSAYRRALFKLERGICVSCRLDCHPLVKRLPLGWGPGVGGWVCGTGCAGNGCTNYLHNMQWISWGRLANMHAFPGLQVYHAGSCCLPPELQAVEKGSRGWEEQRRRIIAARAPRLMVRGTRSWKPWLNVTALPWHLEASCVASAGRLSTHPHSVDAVTELGACLCSDPF